MKDLANSAILAVAVSEELPPTYRMAGKLQSVLATVASRSSLDTDKGFERNWAGARCAGPHGRGSRGRGDAVVLQRL